VSSLPKLRDDLIITSDPQEQGTVYVIRDPVWNETFEFGEKEYFLIIHLDGRTSPESLLQDFQQRYRQRLTPTYLNKFLTHLSGWGLLLADAPETPPPAMVNGNQAPESSEPPSVNPRPPGAETADAVLSMLKSGGLGAGKHPPMHYWRLAKATAFMECLARLARPWAPLIYLLPLGLGIALAALMYNSAHFTADLNYFWGPITPLQHLLLHLLVNLLLINLLSQLLQGLASTVLGGPVAGMGLYLAFGVLPRFHVELDGLDRLSRNHRLWVLATPPLVRITLFSIGVLGWLLSRDTGTQWPFFCLMLALMGAITFLLSANPLGAGDGYRWLTAYLGMPNLRAQAFRALFRWRLAKENDQDQRTAFVAYGLAVCVYLVGLLGLALYLLGDWLRLHFSGTGVALWFILLSWMCWSLLRAFRQRSAQRQTRGRARSASVDGVARTAAPSSLGQPTTTLPARTRRWTLPLLLGLAVLIGAWPYPYETGGSFELMPIQSREIYAQTSGIVEEIFYAGGEWLQAGALVARQSSYRQEQGIAMTRAAIDRQQANLDKLLNTPRPEEVMIADRELQVAVAEEKFQRGELDRQQELLRRGFTSKQQYEVTESQLEVARQRLQKQQANLDLVKAGPYSQDIAAARAELVRLKAQLTLDEELLARTRLIMPIDGRLMDLKLRNLTGKYLEEKDLFTTVLDDRVLWTEISLPEADLPFVALGARTRLKLWAFSQRYFTGKVSQIDTATRDTPTGRVVKVILEVPNPEGLLKPGMTGYAKVTVGEEPLVVAFTHRLVRFVTVEMWSWLP
jgi:putative peptide zinc metalloprotease protein